jgi:hypothetical protein
MVTDFLVPVGAAGDVVRAEVGVAGGGVGEQVPDNDQDRPGDGDLGFGLASPAGDPPVPLPEAGGSAGGSGGGLAEAAAQAGVAVSFLAAAVTGGRTGWRPGTARSRTPGAQRPGTGSCPGRSRR